MIKRGMYNITKTGDLSLFSVKFRCTCCNCEFTVPFEHVIDDAARPADEVEHSELQCNVGRDDFDTIYITVPCPQCAYRCHTTMYKDGDVFKYGQAGML